MKTFRSFAVRIAVSALSLLLAIPGSASFLPGMQGVAGTMGVAGGGNDAFTVLLLHCDGADASTTFTDASASAHSMTTQGNAQIDTAQSVFGGASALFDGTGDYVSAADSADWDLPGDFTIDLWVRGTSWNDDVFLSNYSGWQFSVRNSGNELRWMWGDTTIMARSWSPSTNTWYHVAITRESGTMRMFVDGTQLGATQASAVSFSGASAQLNIGRLSTLGSFTFAGHMDEIRISKGIARWTANFTPPSAPYS